MWDLAFQFCEVTDTEIQSWYVTSEDKQSFFTKLKTQKQWQMEAVWTSAELIYSTLSIYTFFTLNI